VQLSFDEAGCISVIESVDAGVTEAAKAEDAQSEISLVLNKTSITEESLM